MECEPAFRASGPGSDQVDGRAARRYQHRAAADISMSIDLSRPPQAKRRQTRAEQQQRSWLGNDRLVLSLEGQIAGALNRSAGEASKRESADVRVVARKVSNVQLERPAEESADRLEIDDNVEVTLGKVRPEHVCLPADETRRSPHLCAVGEQIELER